MLTTDDEDVKEMKEFHEQGSKAVPLKYLQETNEVVDDCMADVYIEFIRATSLHPPFNSAHEGYSILLEEMEELREHVRAKEDKTNMNAMREEAVQVAAMALRFIIDVCDKGEK
jgi:hypothetical protein